MYNRYKASALFLKEIYTANNRVMLYRHRRKINCSHKVDFYLMRNIIRLKDIKYGTE